MFTEITMEDAIGLCGIQVPDELSVLQGSSRAHHLQLCQVLLRMLICGAHAVNPFGRVEGLVGIRAAIIPVPFHGQVIASLQWNGSSSADFLRSDSYG